MKRFMTYVCALFVPMSALSARDAGNPMSEALDQLRKDGLSGIRPDVPSICAALKMTCASAVLIPRSSPVSGSPAGAYNSAIGTLEIGGHDAFDVRTLMYADHTAREVSFTAVGNFCMPSKPLVLSLHLPMAPPPLPSAPLNASSSAVQRAMPLVPVDTYARSFGALAMTVVRQQSTKDCVRNIDIDYFTTDPVRVPADG